MVNKRMWTYSSSCHFSAVQSCVLTSKTCGRLVTATRKRSLETSHAEGKKIEVAPVPLSYRLRVWKYFGFEVSYTEKVRTISKEMVVCRLYFTELRSTGSTTSMNCEPADIFSCDVIVF